MAEPLPHLRSDARGNRDRILEAGRELFAERGLDVTMREVARRAGVGPATLYRRFPARQMLLDAVFADELRACRGIVEEGCADPDPWRGFCSVVERISVLNVGNQGFVDAFMAENPGSDSFTEHRAAMLSMLARLARRAQDAGRLRADFVLDDLVIVLLAGRGLAASRSARGVAVARRFAALAIEAFRASDTNRPLPRGAAVAAHLMRLDGGRLAGSR
ncbi:TetR/AcrR family transcriptional regulator [Myceligenerans pegani]|uniref:TetR/AcrR family transcriptional regulator n=1 Tax=Myceligenerans pegani TaxID=2776917 RepID=A0ABR9N3W6_9MICO|nr:TetR/AcrR family transcriptional regulator [Myceligenerans sp. TRM 65318]MBE1878352.1 TetR/AcrR family transcriptional regulator [Myceligenerans sp. TRM 65318]MBE3020623.1 TetR/AcrR family transcriptional regulator [Myceligenerans sp. TRM 65318]